VLVFGVGQAQWPRVARRLKRLASFARVVAASIDAAREAHEREQASTAAVSSRYRLQARQIAHEAGNPLAIIRNYLKLLERKLDKEESVARELAFIDEEISRVAQIIQELGDPVTDVDDPPRCDPGALLRELLAGYRAPLFANRGIEVTLDLPAAAPIAAVRREPLLQILLNLWKNASEAMPDGGSYRIEVLAPDAPSGHGLIEIRLRDSGPGMAPELWARLSGGGATSQARGSHGLGLGIVVELVASLGGRIDCASEPGRGTLFSIQLPAAER
jgi:signal transduction histidine kinase